MGCMLRSDPMSFCDIYLQPEAAFETVARLGEMGCIQFIDLNADVKPFLRNYVAEVCRCAEMERKLNYMEGEMLKDKIYVPELDKEPEALQPNEMTTFENILEKWEDDIVDMADNQTSLLKNYLELTEMSYVLNHIGPMLGDAEITRDSIFGRILLVCAFQDVEYSFLVQTCCHLNKVREVNVNCNLMELNWYEIKWSGPVAMLIQRRNEATLDPTTGSIKSAGGGEAALGGRLIVITGVVRRNRSFPFEMMLWRVSRGNIYYRIASQDAILQDPQTGQEIRKVAFLAVCQGEQLSTRMEKVCSGFRVNVYPCPTTYDERMDMINKLDIRISDLEQVLKKTKYHRCKALRMVSRQFSGWMIQIKKSKAIYNVMNMFTLDITKKCLIGRCWVPEKDLPKVQDVLERISEQVGTNVPSFMSRTETTEDPPTYHRTNKFTKGFQALINAYGDSSYGELNPGLYTIITFPFLFALMFGDVCHGLIMMSFAGWMVLSEKKFMDKPSTNEIWNIFFGGRYVILLMSFFTLFTGFMYNEYFCKSITLMTPYWKNTFEREVIENNEYLSLDPALETNPPYIFGVDPVWTLAKNKIMYINSLKMKMSIIIGIVHMIFGLTLSLFNHLHFKRYYAIYLQFIPQILFLGCLFFWLVILIYMKWWMFTAKSPNVKRGTACAPLILILFIDMVLMKESVPVEEECDAYMFEGQRKVQFTLLIIAVICVPIMLFGTPVYLNKYNKKMKKQALKNVSNFRRYQRKDSDKKPDDRSQAEVAKYSHTFGELMIHQAVHTIEFVLSTISHTASYLRLWALSLAHEQLSEMLWVMILAKLALRDHSTTGAFKLVAIFAVWAVFTLSILVIMEGLSAFLHTLRLHWVEFMSKFYTGGGYPFRPFSFKAILYGENKDDKPEAICKKRPKVEY